MLDHFATYDFDGFEEDDDIDETDCKNDFFLENAWNDIVDISDSEENKRLRIQQQSIWEIFTTEVSYIKDLEIIIKVRI